MIVKKLYAAIGASVLACSPARVEGCCEPPVMPPAQQCGTGTAPVDRAAGGVEVPDTLTVFRLGAQPDVHPAPDSLHYAYGKRWYRNDEVIVLGGKRYAKFGWAVGAHPARSGQPGERAVTAGEYDGVPVYGVLPFQAHPRIVLVRLNAACQFQPYAEASEIQ